MLDQNDLRMIGALLDEKLETKLEEKLAPMRKDIGELKEDVSMLKTDVTELKEDVSVLKTDMVEVKRDITVLKENVSELRTDVSGLKVDVSSLKRELHLTEIRLENRMEGYYNDLLGFYGKQIEAHVTLNEEVQEGKRRLLNLEKHIERCMCYFCRYNAMRVS